MAKNYPALCGTVGGYNRHLHRKEDACAECRAARAKRSAEYLHSHPEYKARAYLQNRSRGRAMRRLVLAYPQEYLVIFEEERALAVQESRTRESATSRAWTRLKGMFPQEYAEFYAQAMAED